TRQEYRDHPGTDINTRTGQPRYSGHHPPRPPESTEPPRAGETAHIAPLGLTPPTNCDESTARGERDQDAQSSSDVTRATLCVDDVGTSVPGPRKDFGTEPLGGQIHRHGLLRPPNPVDRGDALGDRLPAILPETQ